MNSVQLAPIILANHFYNLNWRPYYLWYSSCYWVKPSNVQIFVSRIMMILLAGWHMLLSVFIMWYWDVQWMYILLNNTRSNIPYETNWQTNACENWWTIYGVSLAILTPLPLPLHHKKKKKEKRKKSFSAIWTCNNRKSLLIWKLDVSIRLRCVGIKKFQYSDITNF